MGPQIAKNEGNSIFFLIFSGIGTIEKKSSICRTNGGHIETQCICSFQMVPEPGSHKLALFCLNLVQSLEAKK